MTSGDLSRATVRRGNRVHDHNREEDRRVDHHKDNRREDKLREDKLRADRLRVVSHNRVTNLNKGQPDRDQEIPTRVHNRDKQDKDHRVTGRRKETVHRVRDPRDQDLRSRVSHREINHP